MVTQGQGGSVEPDLFLPPPEQDEGDQPPEADLWGPFAARARLVRLNPEAVSKALADEPRRLRLNFFPAEDLGLSRRTAPEEPVDLVGLLGPASHEGGATVSLGRVESDPDSTLSVVQLEGGFSVILTSPRHGLFEAVQFNAAGSLYVARELDEERLPDDCGTEGSPDQEGEVSEHASPADPVVNLMVVHTKAVTSALGGAAGVRARAVDAVARGNQVLQNSGVTVRLRLAHVAELSYPEVSGEDGFYAMLDQLEAGAAPGLEGLHDLRDEHQADAVSLLVANGSLGGLANVMNKPSSAFEKRAYSVVNYAVSSATWTLIHELGHNFGCCHENGCRYARPYARGHAFEAEGRVWKSVMVRKSESGTRIPYFSNPEVSYKGVPTGTEDRNNARVIKEAQATMAAFRPR